MPIAFNCPHCGHAFEVADSYAGQSGPCAACKVAMTIPGKPNAFAGSSGHDPAPPKGSSVPIIVGIVAGVMVLMVMCAGVLAALLIPGIQSTREAARRTRCLNNSKMIALSFHNHHDIYARFPLASTEAVSGIPGTPPGADQAGFGWTVPLLPFLEEDALYEDIVKQTEQFRTTPGMTPFDPAFEQNTSIPYVATTRLNILRCPSYTGPEMVDTSQSDYEDYSDSSGPQSPAISNYIVTSASNILSPEGLGGRLSLGEIRGGLTGNGIIVFPEQSNANPHKGLSMRSVTDGTSKTVLFCESKEAAYSAWIDGQATWGVGAWPENIEVPAAQSTADGFIGFAKSDISSITSLAQAAAARHDYSMIYMEASRFGGSYDRRFGPSSDHADGVVVHAFADGHVSVIEPHIDRNLYLRMITRQGGEPIDLDDTF